MTLIQSTDDVVSFLKSQHEQIKMLFSEVEATSGSQREEAFAELRRLLAVHETAEEEIVHPRAQRELSNGKEIVEARLNEERQAKEALAELEKLDVDSPEFRVKFDVFRDDVLAHAQAEETTEFSQLSVDLEPQQLERMRKAVKFAESAAPTHPHPGTESRTANLLVGPFAAMIDRARDALSA